MTMAEFPSQTDDQKISLMSLMPIPAKAVSDA